MHSMTNATLRGPWFVLVGLTVALGMLLGAAVQAQVPQDEDRGRPVAQVAKELGVTPEQFRAAFRKVRPARPGEQPTEAQRQANRKVLSESLGVSPERLDQVMDKYRPGGKVSNGPSRRSDNRNAPPPPPPTKCKQGKRIP